MPGYKHPCPFCSTFIDSGVAACPTCGVIEPFTSGRCPDCRAALQPGWVACPSCGKSLVATDATGPASATNPAATPTAPTATPAPATAPTAAPEPAPTAGARCAGCGAALPAGARFCTECGTVVA